MLRFFADLESDCALTRDDARIVIGRQDLGAAFGGDALRDFFTAFAIAVVGHDLGTVEARIRDFDRRRIGGHHDRRRHAEKLRRRSDALRVIAGGIGDHAGAALGRIKL